MTRLSIPLTALLLLFAAWQPAPRARYVLTDAGLQIVTWSYLSDDDNWFQRRPRLCLSVAR